MRTRAVILSILMFSLAQTTYATSFRGWGGPLAEPIAPMNSAPANSAACDGVTLGANDPIHVNVLIGDDAWAGTTSCPKATIASAVESASAGDEVIVHEGLYHENITIDGKDDLTLRAATGERVVLDGTRSIADDFGLQWSAADSDGIQEVTLPEMGWQLFLDHEEQVPARWPNAGFDDETVFNRSYWAEGTLTGSNDAYTLGWLQDAGPEAGVHTGLNETINATGLDPVGAIAIMNVGSFRSFSREITSWNASNGTFGYDGTDMTWKTKHHAYFLEGKRELIDVDGEWWLDANTNRLHYRPAVGTDANDLDLRVKVQPFAITVQDSDRVTIQGLDFFGTTIDVNSCDGCAFTNATMEYPSTSRRGQGIAGESMDDRFVTHFYRSTNTFVDRISMTNTDGAAIEFHGSGGQSHNNTVNNSYFHAIDWSAADQKGLMTTIYEGGRDMTFSNNTVHLTGASSVLSIGDAPQVLYNEVWDVGHLQTDGAVVQVMQGEAPGAVIAYNWIHDVIKYGARFDAPINEVGEGKNGTMHHNVIWNAAGGLMVKGDYHDIHNNTVFNSTGKNDIIFLTDGGINNKNSTLHYNAVDAMADHRSDDIFANPIPYGADWMNWNGYIQGKQDAVTTLNGEVSANVDVGSTCIINSTKSLLCWGSNANGRLGLGNTTDQYSYVAVTFPNGGTVEKVADSGGYPLHNCAIMTNGSLYCWGKNSYGQLGIGSTTQQTTPQLVNLGSGVKAVDVSVGTAFTCVVTDAGALMCWGDNGYGKLGIGSSGSNYSTPQNASLPTNRKAVDVQLGHSHACALLDNGDVACWGYNGFGGLGTGNTNHRTSPTVVSLDSQRQVASISPGKHHTCIGYDNGSVVCAGRDNEGQQGRNSAGSTNDLTFSYTNALANLSIIALAGEYVSCALLANGTAQCWGKGGEGQMGDGTTAGNAYPDDLVNTPPGRFIVDMSMSGQHACIVLDDGSVACWGLNNRGQLGPGIHGQQNQPVVLTGLDDLLTTSVHEMLVDPANNDFRPKWGSHLHVLNAGAYVADDADPWTAGISWTYTAAEAPIAGCMVEYADNYDADAIFSDGSCSFSSYTPPSTLDLRLHLDPNNAASYSGSGTNVADLSGFRNNGTIAAAGPTWDTAFTRFTYDGSCTGSRPNLVCDEIEIPDSASLRPGEPGEDLAVELNQGSTVQYLTAPNTLAGQTLGGIKTSFTIQAWVKPTDCGANGGVPTIVSKAFSFMIGCDDGTWQYILGDGTTWHTGDWVDTGVASENDVWQHVALTRASATTGVEFFLNGVESYDVSTYEGDLGDNNAQQLYVGSRSGTLTSTDAWHGLIDDLRIYTSDRSSIIADDMHEYPNVSDDDLNAYFDFNLERHGDTVTSVSNLATGSGASSASLTLVTGSPMVVRTWDASTVGGDTVLTFERTVLTAQGGWRVPTGVSSADVLIVGGGGGGGYNTGGGGGGGGVGFFNSTELPSGSFVPVVVGQGGMGATTSGGNGTNGQPSQLRTSIVGGGGGGAGYLSGGGNGLDAPTGSPAFAQNGSGGGGAHTDGQGGTGATNGGDAALNAGGGGGGAGADGSSVTVNQAGADGGAGLASSITGSNLTYGSGAGGGGWTGAGSGGSGAGNGGRNYAATDGTANRGGGGGGGGNSGDELGGNGGSGAVIVRYSSVDHNDWSVAVWINATSLQNGIIVLHTDDGGTASTNSWNLRIRNTGLLGGAVTTTNGSLQSTNHSIQLDRWYHVVMVADVGNTLRFYIDGVNVGNSSFTARQDTVHNAGNSVYIGSYNGGEFDQPFDGQIGSVMVFADALDSSTITQLYDSGKGVYSNTTNLSYAQGSSSLSLGQAYSLPISVANGEVTTSYSLAGTLPSGMNFESSNGTIWGTPTVTMSSTTYTVTANNSAGTYSTSFSLTVQDIAPYDLSFASEELTLTKGAAMSPNLPTVSGGTVTSWEVSPSLPTGMALNPTDGKISGTPSVLQTTAVNHTVWANNTGGSSSTTLSITVLDAVPDITYDPSSLILTNNSAHPSLPLSPTVTGAGTITSWGINTTLPSGLDFGTTNGTIWGVPTELMPSRTYTIFGNNSGGSNSTTITLVIQDQVPVVDYAEASYTLTKDTNDPDLPIIPSVTGAGTITSWAINQSLPSGLSFGTSNGTIWGTPSSLTSSTSYRVWANNSGGSATDTFLIEVVDRVPIISYPATIEVSNDRALSTVGPTSTGGPVSTYAVAPALPTGLVFSTTNGKIGGTPTNMTGNSTHTIWANNTGGSDSVTLTFVMNWTLTPSVEGAFLTRNASIGTDITFQYSDTGSSGSGSGGSNASFAYANNKLSLGLNHACAILDDGDLKCWGLDGNGQLGNGGSTTADQTSPPSTAIDLGTGRTAVAVAAGQWHTCAILDNGDLKCWGQDTYGQLGDGGTNTDTDAPSTTAIDLGTGRTAVAVSGGWHHTCAILDNGDLKCWGRDNHGQLGNGGSTATTQTSPPSTAIDLGSGRTAVAVSAGYGHTCAILDNGDLKCWGRNYHGQLGDGGNTNTYAPSSTAVNLGTGRTAVAVGASYGHTCAMLDNGDLKCWGQDLHGALGDGGSNTNTNAPSSTAIDVGSGRTSVAFVAGNYHTCAILDNGDAKCWGYDNKGQLGDGGTNTNTGAPSSTAIDLGMGRTAVSVSAGGAHTCAILDNGDAKCWGWDGNGQLGDGGSNTDQASPVMVSGSNTWDSSTGLSGGSGSGMTDVSGATCAISPSLPPGMSLTAGTCAITGTPTVTAVNTTYTIWANISGTSYSGQVWLEVGLNAPILSYSPTSYIFVDGTSIAEVQPVNTGGEVSGYEISPALPNGLSIGSANGTIWGTPTVAAVNATYTIWGNNSAGSSSTTISIKVETTPTSLSYDTENMTLTKGLAMTTNTATMGGGAPTSWAISPTLPSGLSFGATNGTIWGTPTVLQTNAVGYTVWANNTAGSVNTSLNITINDQVASITYPSTIEVSNDRALSTVTPVATGGAVTSWAIDPSLPASLSFGTTNGSIWGTPTGLLANATYTVYGNNSGGSSNTTFTLGLNWTLTPSAEGAYITRNSSIGSDITFQYDDNGSSGSGSGGSNASSFAYANNRISAGGYHTCAILDDGDLKCWGRDSYGQLGNGLSITVDQSSPPSTAIDLGTGRTAVAVSAGYDHTCAILDNGDLKCWGRNSWGQLGEGSTTSVAAPSPTAIDLGTGRTAVAVSSGNSHTCAILDNGDLKCWGRDNYGQLGNGGSTAATQTSPPSTAIDLGSGRTAVAVSVGYGHTCAILDNGDLKCWGRNYHGQLGNGGNTDTDAPSSTAINLGTGRTAVAVAAFAFYTCAILDNGDLKCWGQDDSGQLGDGGTNTNTNAPSSTAIDVGSGRTSVAFVAGNYHTCAILDNGDLKCWGQDAYGQLGDGGSFTNTNAPSATAIDVGAGRTSVAVAAGSQHTCAILDNGDAKCWGRDNYGQLGDGGSNTDQTSPVMVSGSNTWDSSTGVNTGMVSVSGATCAISPSLPTGMSLTSGTCAITGTPTVTAVNATYTVWANISGTSYSGQIYLEVGLNAPILSYSPTSYIFVDGTSIAEVQPVNTGGEVSGYEISPALPNGLSIGSANGSIYGTPTELWTQTSYMVWANNSGGSSVAYLNITVIDVAPSVTYPTDVLNLTVNETSTLLPFAPTSTGGDVTSWVIAPAGPAGLFFSSANGTIWGMPTVLWNTTTYTIWANNSGGSVNVTFNLTVVDQIPTDLTYADLNLSLTNNTAMVPSTPTLTGPGDITGWAIAPSLPAGLEFGTSNGTVWGTPTEILNRTEFTIWANNSGGSVNVTFNLTVVDQVPTELAYADLNLSLTNNTAMVPSTPTLSGSGEITGWAIEPSLPAGLEFGTSNGTVWGTPTELLNRTEFTIWANNSGGSVNVTFNLTVVDQVPTDLTYADLNLSLTNNTAMVPSTPTLTGPGDITGWAIAPSLPAGLEFGTSNGTVWGTPTEILNRTEFTIWANNSGGSVNVTFNLTVVDQIPGMLTMADVQGRNNTAITPTTPTLTGAGTITGWSISPSLPAGLEFGTSNGSIWGTPTAILARTQFTLMASNSGGSVSTIFNLTVVDEVPDSIDLSDVDIQATNNTPLTPIEANLTGSGEITEWSIAPSLPTGVEFGTSNGTIWGTPRQLLDRTMFTIWGNNSGGSVNVTFNLTVVDQVPDELTLPSFDISATNNSMMPPVEVMTSGSGEITLWAIAPALPTGLQFGTANGTIWGTPTQLLARTTYIIWGNNTGGSVNVTFNLTVVDQIPDAIDLTDVDLRATNNTALAPVEFNITGSGAITAWAISPSLPAGLEFGTSNGTIWGTPTALLQRTEFTVWGNNTGGSVNRSFNLTVVDEVPESVNLTSEDIVVTNNTQMSPLETELEGSGEITAWSIHPSLPTGLEFNTSNGTVWGTPTELLNRTTFTIWANNSGGSVNASFNLTVIDQVPTSIDLPSIEVSGTNNTALGPLEVNLTGNGTITTWSIAPSLPTGLELGSANGTIWGTPTQLLNRTEFTLSGNNSGGSVSVRFNLTIVDEVPDSITVPTTELTATNNTAMVPVEVNVTGSGSITAWAIDPVLPNGLQFGPSNGTIWGTPTMLLDRTMFTIWGNNSGGSVHLMFNLTVLDEVPDAFDYVPSTLQATNGTAIVGLTPTFTGRGTILTWAITPSLPAGLQLDPSNGTVWGTPTELRLTPTTHTIWANTSGGSIQTTILVSVLDPELGSFSFQPSSRRVEVNASFSTWEPVLRGTAENLTWTITGDLPRGLSFDATTGSISGTPRSLLAVTEFIVWANNSAASRFSSIYLEVYDRAPMLLAPTGPLSLTVNTTMDPFGFQFGEGGVVTAWGVAPALPAGLSLDAMTGQITGTPQVLQTLRWYTIWANNSGGSDTVTLGIEVIDIPPEITYASTSLQATLGTPIAPVTAISIGGDVVTWSVQPPLPAGMVLDEATGTITGTPNMLHEARTHVISATNSGGTVTVLMTVEVVDVPPSVSVPSSINLTVNHPVPELAINLTGGASTTYSIQPALPLGLYLHPSNGTIAGTPLRPMSPTRFVLTATNSGGTAEGEFILAVRAEPGCTDPMATNFDPLAGQDDGTCIGVDSDGDGTLDEDEVNGCTTPGAYNYDVNATESDGSCVGELRIVYPAGDYELVQGQARIEILPTVIGIDVRDIDRWTIEPPLPAGMVFDELEGQYGDGVLTLGLGSLQGSPRTPMNTTTYLITAYHDASGQEAVYSLNITVYLDTDFDGLPDDVPANSTLLADQDDDGDGSEDELERLCGTDSKNASSLPRTELASTCTLVGSTSGQSNEGAGRRWFLLPIFALIPILAYLWVAGARREEEDVVVATSETPTASAPDSTETLDPVIEGESESGGSTPLPKTNVTVARVLEENGVRTLEDLALRSRDEVADWRGIGPKALETLSGALEEADLSFSE